MRKSILLALSLAAILTPAARAQQNLESATTGDQRGNFTYSTQINYQPVSPDGGGAWGDVGQSQPTSKSGYAPRTGPLGIGSGLGSGILGSALGGAVSGAAQGGPVIIGGYNTKWAPSNIALQTQHRSRIGGQLPVTNLDSFVHQARKNYSAELIYGDEGTDGPPPYDYFTPAHFIERGINQPDLTTGHPSDAPSAWDTPLKYNSMGGVIQGE